MANEILSAELLRELIQYDPETGSFTRTKNTNHRQRRLGPLRPAVSGNGYFYISVAGRAYLAHRLAWLYMHGIWPKGDIDHINGIRTDNRASNIRDVPRVVNNQNRRKVKASNKVSGATGVSWHDHSQKWRARIMHLGIETRLGLFDTIEEASNAYLKAKRVIHAGCTI